MFEWSGFIIGITAGGVLGWIAGALTIYYALQQKPESEVKDEQARIQ